MKEGKSEASIVPREQVADHREEPSLFVEAIEMAYSAISIFGMADIRELARSNMVDQEILKLPVPLAELRTFFLENKEDLKAMMTSRKLFETVFSFLSALEEGRKDLEVLEGGTLEHIGDEKSNEECVYCIITNSVRKRVVVTFRGSITINDWIQDAKIVMGDLQNPLCGQPGQPDTIKIHYGFLEYLYHGATSIVQVPLDIPKIVKTMSTKEKVSSGNEEEGSASKIEEILLNVRAILTKHPDYQVYVTGHSLGGALSLICAMEAAARLETNHPITCVALGNPRTGNLGFRHVMRTLEERGKLRCLCIHNVGDKVPLLPDIVSTGCYLCALRRHNTFRHVGMKMKITQRHFTISYHSRTQESLQHDLIRQARNFFGLFRSFACVCQIVKTKAFSDIHNYQEYLARLQANAKKLRSLKLEEVYKRKAKLSTELHDAP